MRQTTYRPRDFVKIMKLIQEASGKGSNNICDCIKADECNAELNNNYRQKMFLSL